MEELEKNHKLFIQSLLSAGGEVTPVQESASQELPHGSLEIPVVEVREGQLVALRDGLVVDPELLLEAFDQYLAFEKEFGPIGEATERLRLLKRVEESLGPLEELESLVESLEKTAGEVIERLEEGHGVEEMGDLYAEDEYEGEEEEEEDQEEVVDVSELTVKELLLLVLKSLALDDEEDSEDEVDVDLEDLDLENIGDMKVSDVLKVLKETHESAKEGCKPCEEKKRAKLQEGTTDTLGMGGAEVMGLAEPPKEQEEKEEEEEKKEQEETEETEKEKKEESLSQEEFSDLDLFRRLLERLG